MFGARVDRFDRIGRSFAYARGKEDARIVDGERFNGIGAKVGRDDLREPLPSFGHACFVRRFGEGHAAKGLPEGFVDFGEVKAREETVDVAAAF